ncbi:MbnP family copper-binding protein [Alteromonas oceanisediminis]|uniref:MbnP family copper-binding protein n=1 Tax=Alteromonas oceanisediminis TaxID=2836180 RepID=UPI001BD9C17A|nr:MbnP family copper-binding protein [Alteromonas oceanisediminis]MBT0585107.1 metallo-mystery pair system four-Cys motif protein [Alteromonas oceanisediminis]
MNSRQQLTRYKLWFLTAIFVLCVIAGCTQNTPVDANAEARLASIKVPIDLHYGETALACNAFFKHGGYEWALNRFALFISDVEVKLSEQVDWRPLALLENQWQTPKTALIWVGQGCDREPTSNNYNQQLLLGISPQAWRNVSAIRFSMAVPFQENHANPLTQPSPLNISEMFWSWRFGHKFLRLDLTTDALDERKNWSYHLGSVGCQSPSSMRSPEQECAMPNRFTVVLTKPLASTSLAIDLKHLLRDVDIAQTPSCMFQRDAETSCRILADNINTPGLMTWQ